MPSKNNLYKLFDAAKLNPNLIVAGIVIVAVTLILVFSGHHNKIVVSKVIEIETNVPGEHVKDSVLIHKPANATLH
jgi:hypothetical protein